MDDQQIQDRIEELETEERRLRADEAQAGPHHDETRMQADRARLEEVRIELERLWDLLRQRRALRSAGRDPDGAELRSGGAVEGQMT